MDILEELLRREQSYVEQLDMICSVYSRELDSANNPEIVSQVGLYRHPSLIGQHKSILYHYVELLELHRDLQVFLVGEDYLQPDRVGQLFYNGLKENRFDIYLQHSAYSPLRHRSVQLDLTGFLVISTYNLIIIPEIIPNP